MACPSPEQEFHYNDHTGEEWCCVTKECPKGSVGKLCIYGQPKTTKCESCADGFFMPDRTWSHVTNRCREKQECKEEDKSHVEATCVACPTGTYKPSDNFSPCIPWTHCEAIGKIDLKNGSAFNDTTCVSKNVMTSPSPDTTVGILPSVGKSTGKEKTNILVIALPIGLVCAVILVLIAFLIVVRRHSEATRSRQSLSGVERQHLKRSNSTSDSEESLPSKQNEKNLRMLKGAKVPMVPPLDIKKANSGETSVLTNSIHTPDSGIAEIYAALTPTFRPGSNTPRPFILARDVVTDSVPELEEQTPGVNPSSPGRLGGSRSGSTTNGRPSPSDSSGSGHIPVSQDSFSPRGRHESGSTDLPDVHGSNREPVVNQYYINHLIYQNGQTCQVNNFNQPQTSFDEEDYSPDAGDRDSTTWSEQGNYDYQDDGSIRV